MTTETIEATELTEEQREAAEKAANNRRWDIQSQFRKSAEPVAILLTELTIVTDKQEISAIAGMLRRKLIALKELVDANPDVLGGRYNREIVLFDDRT